MLTTFGLLFSIQNSECIYSGFAGPLLEMLAEKSAWGNDESEF